MKLLSHAALLLVIGGALTLTIGGEARALDAQADPATPGKIGPKILIEEPNFDWGRVLHGEVVEHTIRVKNVGDELLRITKVQPG